MVGVLIVLFVASVFVVSWYVSDILWHCLRYGEARLPLKGYVRFDVPSLKIGLSAVCFFIPREIGTQLLQGAGQQVSSLA